MAKVGRPVGWKKAEGVRTQRQMKTYDDEWDLIRRFAKHVKHGNKEKCIQLLQKLDEE